MNEKLLEVLKNEKVQEEIKDLYCKLDKERFAEGSAMGSGWGWTIIVDENKCVDYMYNSFNSTRMDVHNGTAIEVVRLADNAEVPTDAMGDIDFMLEREELEKFKNWISVEFDLEDENEIWEKCTWMNYYEFNSEEFKKQELDVWEAMCDQYSYDVITDKIYDLIQDMEERQNYYNSFQQQEF